MTDELTTMRAPANRQILDPAQMWIAPCARPALLLKRMAAAAGRVSGGGMFLFSRVDSRCDQFQNRRQRAVQVRPMNNLILTAVKFLRGKISRPETQPNLIERTQSAPNR
jgi:hypothetical protein